MTTHNDESSPSELTQPEHSSANFTDQHALAPSPEKQHRSVLREVISFGAVIIVALLLAFGLVAYVFQSYQVSGPSMQNTLHNGNHLIVWKVPRTWARLTGHQYVPKRGDIVIFNEPGLYIDNSSDPQLVKRVIGLPGDRVVVKNGQITIYNKAHPNGFDPDKTLPYHNAVGYTAGDIDIKLSPTQIFVCGDNRGDSTDSRRFGPVEINNIVGRLVLRITPLNQAEIF